MWGYLSNFENDLFDQFERLHRQMDELFGAWPGSASIRDVATGGFPAVNVGASPERVDVYVFAPGLDPKSVNVTLQQNLLTISGERHTERPENARFYRSERFDGAFHRAITLPDDIDPDQVNATYREGVLHITVQRREAVRPRQIEVQ